MYMLDDTDDGKSELLVGVNGNAIDGDNNSYENDMKADLIMQIQTLSRQLLKKQELVLEIQAERAALKSRNNDLQAR